MVDNRDALLMISKYLMVNGVSFSTLSAGTVDVELEVIVAVVPVAVDDVPDTLDVVEVELTVVPVLVVTVFVVVVEENVTVLVVIVAVVCVYVVVVVFVVVLEVTEVCVTELDEVVVLEKFVHTPAWHKQLPGSAHSVSQVRPSLISVVTQPTSATQVAVLQEFSRGLQSSSSPTEQNPRPNTAMQVDEPGTRQASLQSTPLQGPSVV